MARPDPSHGQGSAKPDVDLVGEAPASAGSKQAVPQTSEEWQFNQPVLLRKSPRPSSVIVWTFVGGTALLVAWAFLAPLSETVAVQGKLRPGSKVKLVQAPVDGVVEEVLVREGDSVAQGQLLLRFDLRDPRSKLTSAMAIRSRLVSENSIYAAALGDRPATSLTANQQLQLLNQSSAFQSSQQAALQELLQSQQRLVGLKQSWKSANDIANRFQALTRDGAVSVVQ